MKLTILGGGFAGLAVGYYARKNQIPFVIYEGKTRSGGNSVTFQKNGFHFDSGAHRFHDKDSDVTQEIKKLLDGKIRKNNSPSQIYYMGRFVDFPLSPVNLALNLGSIAIFKAGVDFIYSKIFLKNLNNNFENYAVCKYGRSIADKFLLGYSEKLWGKSCEFLSSEISGKRLQGLDVKTLIIEALFNKKKKAEHLDGSFYYPTKGGIGYISKKLEDYCGVDNIHKNFKVTKIIRNNTHVQAVEINHTSRSETEHVINTLPLSHFLKMLEPPPPQKILSLVDQLHYRSLILVALFLDRMSISPNASIYFPEKNIPFTRIYEPKNRNILMAPPGKTSLVVEIPCQYGDETWMRTDDEHKETVIFQLAKMDFIKRAEIIDKHVKRMRYTYPVLEVNFAKKIKTLKEYLAGFSNLDMTGRNAKFEYIHNHDLMREGLELVKKLKS